MDQTDVGVEAILNVFPVEFDSTRTDPEEDHPGQDKFGEGPTHSSDEDFDLAFSCHSLNDEIKANEICRVDC